MADLTITAIGTTATSRFVNAQVAQAGVPGDVLYLDVAGGNKWRSAIATNNAQQAGRDGLAIQITTTEADGDYALLLIGGEIRMASGASFTQGETYVLSETTSKIAPDSDVSTSGAFKTVIGVAGTEGASTTALSSFALNPVASGNTVP